MLFLPFDFFRILIVFLHSSVGMPCITLADAPLYWLAGFRGVDFSFSPAARVRHGLRV